MAKSHKTKPAMTPQHTVRVIFGFCFDKFDQRMTLVGVVGVIRCRSKVFKNHIIFLVLIPQKDAWEFKIKIDLDIPNSTAFLQKSLVCPPSDSPPTDIYLTF